MALRLKVVLFAAGVACVAGCSMAPTYEVPKAPTPTAFKETGIWTEAAPQDRIAHGQWWTLYGDQKLDGLEARVETANPTLAEALAHYDEARALVREAAAGLYPSIGLGADLNSRPAVE